MDKQKWWKDAVVYEVYPRSFYDSDGDGIGDLPGILKKLDYLQFLGVDVIWLTPIYKSPNCDNGYDIADYQNIMDEFGSMEDFDRLLSECHERGMKLVMDLVVNHTSDEHPWFEASKRGEEPYRDYYIWKPGKNGDVPNNWGSWFSGPAWDYEEQRGQYYLHIFAKKQPDLNWDNPRVRQDVYRMMRWWLDKGVDGFRMDVISMLSKDAGFPDGEVKNGLYGDLSPFCMHGPHIHEYLKEMNREVLCRYDILTVGETSGVTVDEALKYASEDGTELDMVFWFDHVELGSGKYGKWNDLPVKLSELKEVFEKWETGLDGKAWSALFLDNHDQPRMVSRFGDDTRYRIESAKMLATCLHMMKGTPYIFQGEELGMTNAYFENIADYRDVESINAYRELVEDCEIPPETAIRYLKAKSRDNARTPMQWSGKNNAGFTTGEPWIKINQNYHEINAEDQIQDENSVLHYYRKLIRLRHELPVIVHGDFTMLLKEDENIFAYERRLENTVITVLCNFTETEVACEMRKNPENILISNYECPAEAVLRPYEAVVYKTVD